MNQKKYVNTDFSCDKVDSRHRLAHAYVPFQKLEEVFGPTEALCKGTLFPNLYMPYHKSNR